MLRNYIGQGQVCGLHGASSWKHKQYEQRVPQGPSTLQYPAACAHDVLVHGSLTTMSAHLAAGGGQVRVQGRQAHPPSVNLRHAPLRCWRVAYLTTARTCRLAEARCA